MRHFSIPYNFKLDYIEELSKRKDIINKYIDFIYLPCFKNDGDNSRYKLELNNRNPQTWEEYKSHISSLQKYIDIAILIQNNVNISSIDKYYNLGIRTFITGDDDSAKSIKNTYKDVNLILSITRLITEEELNDSDLSMYSLIVLPFNYCRQIDRLKNLPSRYNYSIIINSHCLYNCNRSKAHWQLKANSFEEYVEKEGKLTHLYCEGVFSEERAFIPVEDLVYFDNYISQYKLVDRLDDTEDIMRYIDKYCKEIKDNPKHEIIWYNL